MKIEFYHDAVCGWCYIESPRLRKVALEFNIEVVHRAFVLQRNEDEMIARFGSMELAKKEILKHWESCLPYTDDPTTVNVEGMRATDFKYPSGYLAAKAAIAAGIMAGQKGHWDFFDGIQKSHMYLNKNISDRNVLLEVAKNMGFEIKRFEILMDSEEVSNRVELDNKMARNKGIVSIPTIVIDGKKIISSVLTEQDTREIIQMEMSGSEV